MTRPGTTLLELLVTLAIIAVASAVVGLALRAPAAPAADDAQAAVAAARRAAIAERRPVTVALRVQRESGAVTALPDGGVVADSALGRDRLTGERR
jgi:prepilin-type N-terminal cleavage/methylation domain-containing protein